jgi:hypothetical protein
MSFLVQDGQMVVFIVTISPHRMSKLKGCRKSDTPSRSTCLSPA